MDTETTGDKLRADKLSRMIAEILADVAVTDGAESERAKRYLAICAGIDAAPVDHARAWMPIETAPRDGTRILLCGPDYGTGPGFHLVIGHCEADAWRESGWEDYEYLEYATHWMPLPNPPTGKPEGDDKETTNG